ncbi:DUF305 domain-containing protein [Microbacterium deminutum]
MSASSSAGAPTPSGSASTEPVTADDFCYVEAMIYYRVEAVDLAKDVLDKTGVSRETRAFAQKLVDEQSAELEALRPWYVSWTGARPLERPDEGPCGAGVGPAGCRTGEAGRRRTSGARRRAQVSGPSAASVETERRMPWSAPLRSQAD